MSTLICPVTRKVATSVGSNSVLGELVNWSGVSLFLHKHEHNLRILGTPEWTCSHERTGYAIAHGPSPEAALAAAIEKIRNNGLPILQRLTSELPALNP